MEFSTLLGLVFGFSASVIGSLSTVLIRLSYLSDVGSNTITISYEDNIQSIVRDERSTSDEQNTLYQSHAQHFLPYLSRKESIKPSPHPLSTPVTTEMEVLLTNNILFEHDFVQLKTIDVDKMNPVLNDATPSHILDNDDINNQLYTTSNTLFFPFCKAICLNTVTAVYSFFSKPLCAKYVQCTPSVLWCLGIILSVVISPFFSVLGLALAPASVIVSFTSINIVLTVAFSALFIGEHVSVRGWIGSILACIGVLLMILFSGEGSIEADQLIGNCLHHIIASVYLLSITFIIALLMLSSFCILLYQLKWYSAPTTGISSSRTVPLFSQNFMHNLHNNVELVDINTTYCSSNNDEQERLPTWEEEAFFSLCENERHSKYGTDSGVHLQAITNAITTQTPLATATTEPDVTLSCHLTETTASCNNKIVDETWADKDNCNFSNSFRYGTFSDTHDHHLNNCTNINRNSLTLDGTHNNMSSLESNTTWNFFRFILFTLTSALCCGNTTLTAKAATLGASDMVKKQSQYTKFSSNKVLALGLWPYKITQNLFELWMPPTITVMSTSYSKHTPLLVNLSTQLESADSITDFVWYNSSSFFLMLIAIIITVLLGIGDLFFFVKALQVSKASHVTPIRSTVSLAIGLIGGSIIFLEYPRSIIFLGIGFVLCSIGFICVLLEKSADDLIH